MVSVKSRTNDSLILPIFFHSRLSSPRLPRFFRLVIHCFLSFGCSRQKKWKQSKGDFESFCRKVGWTTTDGEVERKKRWFGASEFIYDVQRAPEGHMPLTSALRGTSLIKKLLDHPLWENDDWKLEA
jgi:GUN4-like